MGRHEIAKVTLRTAGLVLMLSSAVQLLAAPQITHLFDGLSPRARGLAIGPAMLDHLLAGILLMPFGFTTWMAAAAWYRQEAWARPILLMNSMAVFAIAPITMFFIGPIDDSTSPLVLLSAVLTALTVGSIPIGIIIGGSAEPRPA